MNTHPRRGLAAAALVAALVLTGCGAGDETTAAQAAPTPTMGSTDAAADAAADEVTESGIVLTDGWAKAVDETGPESMTGVFGTLRNTTDEPVRLTGGSSDAAHMIELHETAMVGGTMVMREAEGGFLIEPGDTLVLEPGGNHIMLMGLSAAIETGTDVDITLTAEDGTTYDIVAAARTFAGAQETYAPGHGTDEHGDDDSDEHGDGDSGAGSGETSTP